MAINFNTDPYWDDFEVVGADGLTPKEKYNRVLFRPGVPLQARELTQLQTTLQNQISSMGDHIFKEGTMVIPGELTLNHNIDYVKISTANNAIDFIGMTVTGSNGTTAKVVYAIEATDIDPATLYLKYTNNSIDDIYYKNITINGSYEDDLGNTQALSATVENELEDVLLPDQYVTGTGSIANIEKGIYYIRKNFIIIQSASIVVNKYNADITTDIGFFVIEKLVGPGEDTSLNDNANGSTNETAPGAHRLSITATFGSKLPDISASNFVLLARIENGKIISINNRTDNSFLEETLARRTKDESGSYTVNTIKGILKDIPSDANRFHYSIDPFKAYVDGREINIEYARDLEFDKARTTELAYDQTANFDDGNYIDIRITGGSMPKTGNVITLTDSNFNPTTLMTASVLSIREVTSFYAAGAGTIPALTFRLSLANIDMVEENGDLSNGSIGLNLTVFEIAGYSLSGDDNLVYLPKFRVKTCHNGTSYDYRYEIIKNIGTSQVRDTNKIDFDIPPGESFTDTDTSDWVVWYNNEPDGTAVDIPLAVTDFSVGTLSDISGGSNNFVTLTVATPAGAPTITNNTIMELSAPVIKYNAMHKTKTLIPAEEVVIVSNTFPAGNDWIELGFADGVDLISVMRHTDYGTGQEAITNITSHYEFDNGQRTSHYESAKIRKEVTSNFIQPDTASTVYKVQFSRYVHGGSGDFFNVDSYIDGGNEYDNIGFFKEWDLADCVDFRPTILDTTDSGNWSTLNGLVIRPNSTFETDLEFYLPRIDKLALTAGGKFKIIKGNPAANPTTPDDAANAMTLTTLLVPPYTEKATGVKIKPVDNKRYTMRDIGKIEKRINQLEYYTTLSLLETQAKNKQIYSGTLIDRFKTGIITDAFGTPLVSRTESPEYNVSLDAVNRLCRPTFAENNINLTSSAEAGTAVTGDLLTLDYDNVDVITQLRSSSHINVNPFDVFTWEGSLKITPENDEWKDVKRMPAIQEIDESKYADLLNDAKKSNPTGTIWGEWETNWTGYPDTAQSPTGVWDPSGNTWRTDRSDRGQRRVDTWIKTGYMEQQIAYGIESAYVKDIKVVSERDRTVNVSFIPYMRSRLVTCNLTGCRPETPVYPFFDGVNVSNYVSDDIINDPDEYSVAENALLDITEHPSGMTSLTTNEFGSVDFSFWVPNNDNLNFTTGTKELHVTDSVTGDPDFTTTFATAKYAAQGLLESKEMVTIGTRIPKIVQTERSKESENFVATDQTMAKPTHWYDPLAQSFKIDIAGGVFITEIDLYFTTKDISQSVKVQIREMSNGFPTQKILGFGEAIKERAFVFEDTDGLTPTTFTFDSPVYVAEGTEYCFAIVSNSSGYNVRYGEVGEKDENDDMIQAQPYAGVMFKSSNASTWEPMSYNDIKFVMRMADFSTTGTVDLIPTIVPPERLAIDPIETTVGSSDVTIHQYNHGYNSGSTIQLSNISGSVDDTGLVDGSFVITVVNDDKYTISASGVATDGGLYGGGSILVGGDILYNIIYPFVESLNLPNTAMTWEIHETATSNGTTFINSVKPIDINSNYIPADERFVLTSYTANNASPAITNHGIKLRGTFITDHEITLHDVPVNNLSPVVDLARTSLITVQNHINNDSTDETHKFAGKAKAKYVTKTILLNDESDDLKLWLDINRPTHSNIKVYARVGHQNIDYNDWVEGTVHDSSGVSGPGRIPFNDGSNYHEVEFDFDFGVDTTFTMFAIKVVFLSSNTSRIPSIKNLRAVAVI